MVFKVAGASVAAGCLNAGKLMSANCTSGCCVVAAEDMFGAIWDCASHDVERLGIEPKSADIGGREVDAEGTELVTVL